MGKSGVSVYPEKSKKDNLAISGGLDVGWVNRHSVPESMSVLSPARRSLVTLMRKTVSSLSTD